MMPALQERWNALAKREKRMVSIAGAVVLLALVYGLGIDPALRGIRAAQKDLPEARRRTAEVKAYADEARRLNQLAAQSSRGRSEGKTLPMEIQQSLERANFQSMAKLEGSASLPVVKFTDAPFSSIVEWLSTAPKELSIRVVRTRFERVGEGRVNGEVALEPPANAR